MKSSEASKTGMKVDTSKLETGPSYSGPSAHAVKSERAWSFRPTRVGSTREYELTDEVSRSVVKVTRDQGNLTALASWTATRFLKRLDSLPRTINTLSIECTKATVCRSSAAMSMWSLPDLVQICDETKIRSLTSPSQGVPARERLQNNTHSSSVYVIQSRRSLMDS